MAESDPGVGEQLGSVCDLKQLVIGIREGQFPNMPEYFILDLLVIQHLRHFLILIPLDLLGTHALGFIQGVELAVVKPEFQGVFPEAHELMRLGQPIQLQGNEVQDPPEDGDHILQSDRLVDFREDLQSEKRKQDETQGGEALLVVLRHQQHQHEGGKELQWEQVGSEQPDNDEHVHELGDQQRPLPHLEHPIQQQINPDALQSSFPANKFEHDKNSELLVVV